MDVDDVKKVFSTTNPAQMSPDVERLQNELISTSRELANASDTATGQVNPEDASGITSSDYPHMVLQADGSLTCNGERYAVADVKSFRLSTTDYAGADGTRQGASDILVLQSDTLFGQGDVRVCDMEGRVVAEGRGEACLAALPAGVYVVSQGSKTVKICKR